MSGGNALLRLLVGAVLWPTAGISGTPYDPTNDLIAAFGTQCSSSGDLTNTAIAQSGALKGIIASIRDDDACKGLLPLVNNIETDLQSNLQTHSDVDQLGATVDDLEAAIQAEQSKGAAADQTYIATLSSERSARQIELLKAKQNILPNPKTKTSQAVKNFYNHSTAFLDGLGSNSACLNKHPNILAQAGAQILKLSADVATGFNGAILLATGGLIDHFVQFVRGYEINRDLRDIMTARMGQALGCTFEGLASTYCKARDIQFIVDANRNIQQPDVCSTIAQGTNLLSRDLSVFSDFVSTIYAGSKASSSATAGEKLTVINLRSSLETLRVTIDGDTNTYERNYNSSSSQEGKDNAVRRLITALSQKVGSNINATKTANGTTFTQIGPIGDAFTTDPDCGVIAFYYTRSKERACQRNQNELGQSNGCQQCILRTHPGLSLPTIAEIKESSKTVLGFGDEYVSQQSTLYNQNNPQLALTMAETYGQNRKRAMDFLYDARTYLQHLISETDGIAKGNVLKTINLSLKRIDSVIEKLEASAKDSGAKPEDFTKDLADLLAPSSDTYYIPRELSTIVKHDIDVKLANGKIDKNLALILQLSTSDSLSELMNNYGSLEALRNQVRGAKKLTKANLDAVGKVFSGNILNILDSLQQSAKNDSDARDDLNLFCIQTLLIPSSPIIDGNDLSKYCGGAKYQSLYGNVGALDFNNLANKSYEERACSVYDFYRKARLSGLGIKPGAGK